MATQYVIDLKKNVLRWMKQKLEKWWALWRAPSWYINDKNTNEYEVDKKESEFIKEIFELRSRNLPYKEISNILYKKWFKSKTWKPKTPGTLEQIIRNEFYIWIIQFQGEKAEWKHKTYISKEIFDEANWLRRKTKISLKENHEEFIFNAFLKYQWKSMRWYKIKWNVYYRECSGVKPALNISQKILLEKIEEELNKISSASEIIDSEICELFKILIESQKVFKNADLLHKGLFLKMFLCELSLDTKKQLSISNTELFGLLREMNFTLWQAHEDSNPERRIWSPAFWPVKL